MTLIGGAGPRSGRATWGGETVVVACMIAVLVPMGLLHVSGTGAVDPLTVTISDYAYLPGGFGLLTASAFALAAAAAVLAGGLRSAGLPRPDAPATLLLSAAAALVLVAVFPTNEPGTTAGVVATVHRVAGGWALGALPLAGWMVARRAAAAPGWTATARVLTRVSGTAGVLGAAFILSHVLIVITGSPGFALLGGFQRVLCVAVMVVLVTTARATRLAMDAVPTATAVFVGHELRGAM